MDDLIDTSRPLYAVTSPLALSVLQKDVFETDDDFDLLGHFPPVIWDDCLSPHVSSYPKAAALPLRPLNTSEIRGPKNGIQTTLRHFSTDHRSNMKSHPSIISSPLIKRRPVGDVMWHSRLASLEGQIEAHVIHGTGECACCTGPCELIAALISQNESLKREVIAQANNIEALKRAQLEIAVNELSEAERIIDDLRLQNADLTRAMERSTLRSQNVTRELDMLRGQHAILLCQTEKNATSVTLLASEYRTNIEVAVNQIRDVCDRFHAYGKIAASEVDSLSECRDSLTAAMRSIYCESDVVAQRIISLGEWKLNMNKMVDSALSDLAILQKCFDDLVNSSSTNCGDDSGRPRGDLDSEIEHLQRTIASLHVKVEQLEDDRRLLVLKHFKEKLELEALVGARSRPLLCDERASQCDCVAAVESLLDAVFIDKHSLPSSKQERISCLVCRVRELLRVEEDFNCLKLEPKASKEAGKVRKHRHRHRHHSGAFLTNAEVTALLASAKQLLK